VSSSLQNKLSRIGPPRVHLTRDVEVDGAIVKREFPYVIGVLADLTQSSEHRTPLGQRAFVEIDRDSFDAVMAEVAPSVRVPVAGGREVKLSFSSVSDFEPIHLIAQVPEMVDAHRRAQSLGRLLSHLDGNDAFADFLVAISKDTKKKQLLATDLQDGSGKLLDRALEAGFLTAAGEERENNLSALADALPALEPETRDPYAEILARTEGLNAGLSPDLNAILGNPAFQELEATWRGLWFLVARAETGPRLKIRVLDVSQEELRENFKTANTPQESVLHGLIKSEIYRSARKDPFSVLIGNYEFDLNGQDLELLGDIRSVAADAVCPFLSALASPHAGMPPHAAKKQLWQAFRTHRDGDFVHLCTPRILLRLPYGPDTAPSEVDAFEEDVTANGPQPTYLWGNPAWHLGERISRAVTTFGWPAAISGRENGGLLEGVPRLDAFDDGQNGALEVPISPEAARELDITGFVTASAVEGHQSIAFSAAASEDLNAAQMTLPRILTAARFAQCAHLVARERLAASQSLEKTQAHLETWIAQYVLLDDSVSREARAGFPLRSGRVRLSDGADGLHSLGIDMTVEPHFMLPKSLKAVRFKTVLPEVRSA